MTTNEKRSFALKGRKKTPEHIEKVRLANLGVKRSEETRNRLRISHLGKTLSEETCKKLSEARRREWAEGRRKCSFMHETWAKASARAKLLVGPRHPRWIADRTKLAKKTENRSTAIVTWASAVKRRDKRSCALAYLGYGGCGGRLEAHHIHPWRSNPALRFQVSNGITLCAGHHPRKRSEEDRLLPLFEKIVSSREGENYY